MSVVPGIYEELSVSECLEARPWMSGDQPCWIEILPQSVTGRWLSRPGPNGLPRSYG